MKLLNRRRGIMAVSAAAAVLSAALLAYPMGSALSQQPPTTDHVMPDHGQMSDKMQQHHQQMMQMHGPGPGQTATTSPTMPGQDAFGAVQEIVRILEADPKTDWSKVNLEALRQHLIDMNEVTLKADAAAKSIDGGVEIAVTGSGRTLAAIQRMVPAHAHELDMIKGWSAKTASLPDGVLLTVTSGDPSEVQHIRGLGFIGLLVSGGHHQPHHLAMARGEFSHQH
jgi:hypothetical protein